ncbi:hypothetical protein GUJ93_ZPchr0014g46576 [Zizania palustris]|uniref:Uncharacterized protein n=1 Tax=Zizania palustris TaxID=103762 RepID=A0A8J5TG28_ZIZPA|nr:hypothetical protein GUJ93_ZPchr0014g46576 [Zizania palustris]
MAVLLRPAAIAGGRQVWPVAEDHQRQEDAEAVSQRLVEAVARGDAREAGELLASGRADVNYAGVVWLKARQVAEASLRDGAAAELRAAHEEIRADVSPLFLAAGNGDAALVRALLIIRENASRHETGISHELSKVAIQASFAPPQQLMPSLHSGSGHL